ncbi:hypothetical protein [Ekhidna sp. To15]|uniref:hypothetical protein n=1 Tax=Ekhidna sp. To15 TaxID=3395267 RepID=UPI003F520C3B
MIELNTENKVILLEALEDLMYKLSLQLEDLKGGPLDKRRKELSQKQAGVEKLQHLISTS